MSEQRGSFLSWFRALWQDLLRSRKGRSLIIAILTDSDIYIRDGLAYSIIARRFYGRKDVRYRYVPAYRVTHSVTPLEANGDLLFIGRPKPFLGTSLGPFAQLLECEAAAVFHDQKNGERGRIVQYGNRLFERELLEQPLFGEGARTIRDYGIFMVRRLGSDLGARSLVSIGGIGSLGTLGTAVLLDNDEHRSCLAEQINSMVNWTNSHRPLEQFEICVRIELPGQDRLAQLLHGVSSGNRAAFDYEVEAVAVGTADGRIEMFVLEDQDFDLEIMVTGGEFSAGKIRAAGKDEWRTLSPLRFAALMAVIEHPERATPEELSRLLTGLSGRGQSPGKPRRNTVSKLIGDLNKDLTAPGMLPARFSRPVRYKNKLGRYAPHDLRVVVRRPGAPPARKRVVRTVQDRRTCGFDDRRYASPA